MSEQALWWYVKFRVRPPAGHLASELWVDYDDEARLCKFFADLLDRMFRVLSIKRDPLL